MPLRRSPARTPRLGRSVCLGRALVRVGLATLIGTSALSALAAACTGTSSGDPPFGLGGLEGGTSHALRVEPEGIDFGAVSCGAAPAAQTFRVTNTSTKKTTWLATLGKARGGFVLTPSGGVLEPGEGVDVTVTPASVPSVASTEENGLGDLVTLTADTWPAPRTVPLRLTARGAIVAASAANVDFGNVPRATGKTHDLELVNRGNAPASLTVADLLGTK